MNGLIQQPMHTSPHRSPSFNVEMYPLLSVRTRGRRGVRAQSVSQGEWALTELAFAEGGTIDCLLTEFAGIDWRNRPARETVAETRAPPPQAAYSPSPYEILFTKTLWAESRALRSTWRPSTKVRGLSACHTRARRDWFSVASCALRFTHGVMWAGLPNCTEGISARRKRNSHLLSWVDRERPPWSKTKTPFLNPAS